MAEMTGRTGTAPGTEQTPAQEPRTPDQAQGGTGIGRRTSAPLLWVLPALLLLLAIRYVPMISGAGYAFTDWDGLSSNFNVVGLENFEEIFTDKLARGAVLHTVVLAVTFVAAANLLGLVLAVGLNSAVRSRNLVRAIFFIPVVLSPLATSYIWRFIYQEDGPLNRALAAVGLDSMQRTWLADPTWALWTVWFVLVWQFVGLTMVIYLAGLQGIPAELTEASAVDGASPWRRFRRIILPLLAPATTVALTLSLIYGLGVFDQVMALTAGGPAGATETLATQIYKETFVSGRFGYGTALALVLTVLITLAAFAQLAVLRRQERRI